MPSAEGATGQKEKKVSRQSYGKEIYGMYKMARSEHKRSQKTRNTNIICSSNPNICNTLQNFLFYNISNQKFCFINCSSGIHWILPFLGEDTCVLHSPAWQPVQISRNHRVFINICREVFV